MRSSVFGTVQAMGLWHDRGLFMGMHWVWWSVWALTIGFLLWALWRVVAERAGARRRAGQQELAEEALRRRFAEGEINEDEFAKRMRVLRGATSGDS